MVFTIYFLSYFTPLSLGNHIFLRQGSHMEKLKMEVFPVWSPCTHPDNDKNDIKIMLKILPRSDDMIRMYNFAVAIQKKAGVSFVKGGVSYKL